MKRRWDSTGKTEPNGRSLRVTVSMILDSSCKGNRSIVQGVAWVREELNVLEGL